MHWVQKKSCNFILCSHKGCDLSQIISDIIGSTTLNHEVEYISGGVVNKISYADWLKFGRKYSEEYLCWDGDFLSEAVQFPPVLIKTKVSEIAHTIKETLINTRDSIFAVITDYNCLEHARFLKYNANDYPFIGTISNHEDRILIMHPNQNVFFNVRCTNADVVDSIQEEFEKGIEDIKLFSLVNKSFFSTGRIIMVNVVAAPMFVPSNAEVELCRECHLIHKDILNNKRHLQTFLENLINKEYDDKKNTDNDASKGHFMAILSHTLSFMATGKAVHSIPSITNNNAEKIDSLMLNVEQLRILYSDERRKIIKGDYGTGKSLLGLSHLTYVTNHAEEKTVMYYICWDHVSLLLHDVRRYIRDLRKNEYVEIIPINIVDLSKQFGLLELPSYSKLLDLLFQKHCDVQLHIVIDELDGERMDKEEAQNLHDFFQSAKYNMKNSLIVFLPQSIEKHRTYQCRHKRIAHDKYHFELTGMTVFVLSKCMRATKRNFEFTREVESMILESRNLMSHPPLPNGQAESSNSSQTEFVTKPAPVHADHDDSYKDDERGNAVSETQEFDQFETPIDVDVVTAQLPSNQVDTDIHTETEFKCTRVDAVGHGICGQKPAFVHIYQRQKNEAALSTKLALCLEDIILRSLAVKRLLLFTSNQQMHILKKVLEILGVEYIFYHSSTNYKLIHSSGGVCETLPKHYNLLTNYQASRGREAEEVIVAIDPLDSKLRHLALECFTRSTSRLVITSLSKIGSKSKENVESTGDIMATLVHKKTVLEEVCIKSMQHPNTERPCLKEQFTNRLCVYVNTNSRRFKELYKKAQSLVYEDTDVSTLDPGTVIQKL